MVSIWGDFPTTDIYGRPLNYGGAQLVGMGGPQNYSGVLTAGEIPLPKVSITQQAPYKPYYTSTNFGPGRQDPGTPSGYWAPTTPGYTGLTGIGSSDWYNSMLHSKDFKGNLKLNEPGWLPNTSGGPSVPPLPTMQPGTGTGNNQAFNAAQQGFNPQFPTPSPVTIPQLTMPNFPQTTVPQPSGFPTTTQPPAGSTNFNLPIQQSQYQSPFQRYQAATQNQNQMNSLVNYFQSLFGGMPSR